VVVAVGFAVTDDEVVDDRPVEGDQLYDDPPDAVIVADFPEHTDALVAEIAGRGLTTTVLVAVAVQPLALEPVTVYVVVDVCRR
jgi:hypothetical protein